MSALALLMPASRRFLRLMTVCFLMGGDADGVAEVEHRTGGFGLSCVKLLGGHKLLSVGRENEAVAVGDGSDFEAVVLKDDGISVASEAHAFGVLAMPRVLEFALLRIGQRVEARHLLVAHLEILVLGIGLGRGHFFCPFME